MNDKTSFKKTLYRFNHEANVLLRSNWEESPMPFKRFLDRIEAESVIKTYLDDCVENHTPEGFDAANDVREVTESPNTRFANFSTIPEEESAEVYLILKHMIANNVQGHSCFYYGYSSGNKFADMYQGFLDKVVRRLISNVSEHLILIGIEMGLDDSSSATTNFYGNVRNAQVNQPSGESTVSATQVNGLDASDIETLFDNLLAAAYEEIGDEETINDLKDNIEIVRDQIESQDPNRGVIKSFLTFLQGINGGAQFTAAVVQIVNFLNAVGFQFPLPG